jgi:hypothetical protein
MASKTIQFKPLHPAFAFTHNFPNNPLEEQHVTPKLATLSAASAQPWCQKNFQMFGNPLE